MTRPNFFIAGAPKCGTTSLSSYLQQHPDVFMPARKEPRYFAPDLDTGSERDARYFVRSEAEYLELFAPAAGRSRAGEATALYLYSGVAAQKIAAFAPDARIIVMLRNPVDLMYAFHGERVANGNEDITDFSEALAAERDRKEGKRTSPRIRIPKALQYRDIARLAAQVERFQAHFPARQIHTIVFDDFQADTAAEFAKVVNFLGLEPFQPASYDVVNPSRRVRSENVVRMLTQPSGLVGRLARVVPQGVRTAVAHRVRQWNLPTAPRPPLDPALREQLRQEFHDEIVRLEHVVGRDLHAWRNPAV